MSLPEEERDMRTSQELKDDLAMTLGGYAAERLVFGDLTTGASTDIRHASELSRRMLTHWGMDDEIGPIYLGGEQEVFLGRDFAQQSRNYSEAVAAKIDHELQKMLRTAYERAEKALRDNLEKLHALAALLIEKETIDGMEFEAFVAQ